MDYTPLPPEWIERIKRQYPHDSEDFIKAVDDHPKTSIRWHRVRSKGLNSALLPEWLQGSIPVPWSEHGIFLKERPVFTLDPLFHAGAYYVQEASSMFLTAVLEFLNLTDNPLILDSCAAPGGKSTAVLDFLHHRGFLVANEVIPNRSKIAAMQLSRWGYDNFMVTRSPIARFGLLSPLFDAILVDAPCSGEGMFRKSPHARGEWSTESAAQCAIRQASILDDLWPAVLPGGYLIYSTCTFNPEENERQLEQLLSRADAEWVDLSGIAPSEAKAQGGGISFLPHRASGEGFFLAVVRKKGRGDDRVDGYGWSEPPKIVNYRKETWLIKGGSERIIAAIPGLQLVQNGRGLQTVKGSSAIPHQHAAWQLIPHETAAPRIELTLAEAHQYLKGLSIAREANRGWAIVTYANLPLGWIKSTGNRLNNHYLKSERIAMDLV